MNSASVVRGIGLWSRASMLILASMLLVASLCQVGLAKASWIGPSVPPAFVHDFDKGVPVSGFFFLSPKISNQADVGISGSNRALGMTITMPSGLAWGGCNRQNVLLLGSSRFASIPYGMSFRVETQVLFHPEQNFEDACLLVYKNDDNFLALGHAFAAPGSTSWGMGVGNGIYFDKELSGVPRAPNYATQLKFDPVLGYPYRVWLRITRIYVNSPSDSVSEQYIGEYSVDGCSWQKVGTHTFTLLPSDVRVGIAVWNGCTGAIGKQALFDYFGVAELPYPGHVKRLPTTLALMWPCLHVPFPLPPLP